MPPLNDFINISKHFQKMCLVLFLAVSYLRAGSLLAMLARPCDAPASLTVFVVHRLIVLVSFFAGCL
jgi:hypothetical protein